MGKFRQILTELSARDIFSFPDDNLSKSQGILTKLGTFVDIRRSGLGLLMGIFYRGICPRQENGGVLSFYVFISEKIKFDFLSKSPALHRIICKIKKKKKKKKKRTSSAAVMMQNVWWVYRSNTGSEDPGHPLHGSSLIRSLVSSVACS